MGDIRYTTDSIPVIEDIISVYNSSGINRPTHDFERIQKMYENSNLVISAWNGEILIGIVRSLSDFSYCCYLSDLAVRSEYQHRGIGKKLIALTKEAAGSNSMLLLLSAQEAMEYYPKVGFKHVDNGFIIKREVATQ